ncbi:MAG: hypothetical protein ACJA1E_001173, partial [Paracoccaceae bacterium]
MTLSKRTLCALVGAATFAFGAATSALAFEPTKPIDFV